MGFEEEINEIFDDLDVDLIEKWSKQDILLKIRVWHFEAKEDVLAVYRLHYKKLLELRKNRPPKSCTNHASLRLYYEEAEKVFEELEGLLKK